MQNQDVQNAAPDWATEAKDLLCPLCRYNLRGLSQPRCPECGFKFTWRELIDAEKNRHPYLFEYGKGRNFVTLWKTYWRTNWPRRFWSDLNPAQPVHLGRLLVYWLIATGLVASIILQPNAAGLLQNVGENISNRMWPPPLGGLTPSDMLQYWPLPWEAWFWRQPFPSSPYSIRNALWLNSGFALILLCWPWVTLMALMVFRRSMLQAKIRLVHLVRTTLYCCDLGMVLFISYLIACCSVRILANGWFLVLAALLCCTITTYRLGIAFRQYLRVHLPVSTAIASQLIALLVTFLALCSMNADFSRNP